MSVVNKADAGHVRFVSYTGKWPNLCRGILTLEIDGVEHRFGYDSGQHGKFWSSGGECGFSGNYTGSYVHAGEWKIDAQLLPEELKCYVAEIDEIFNSNVVYGCCGGCL